MVYERHSSKEHMGKELDFTRGFRLNWNRTEYDGKAYLSVGQSYRWNTLILQFVYIAHNVLKGFLIDVSIYFLNLQERRRNTSDICVT